MSAKTVQTLSKQVRASTATRLPRDDNLPEYFTNRDELLGSLRRDAEAAELPRQRIRHISGGMGQGKTAILRMFRLWCDHAKLPCVFMVGKNQLTEIAVLRRIYDDLVTAGVKLPKFRRQLRAYDDARSGADKRSDALAKDVADLTTDVGSRLAKSSPVPIPINGIGGLIKLLVDWRSFRRGGVLREPVPQLTEALLADLAQAKRRRLVFLLDQYEGFDAVDMWLCGLLRDLPPNILVITAGRSVLGGAHWDSEWPDWITHVHSDSLDTQPLTAAENRTLACRLFRAVAGRDASKAEVQAIMRSGVTCPLAIECEVIIRSLGYQGPASTSSDLVTSIEQHFLGGLDPETRRLTEIAATVRVLTREVLGVLAGEREAEQYFSGAAQRLFPNRSADEWTMHGSVRAIIDDSVKMQSGRRYTELHEKAADYYRQKLGQPEEAAAREQREKWQIERIYHEFAIAQKRGMKALRSLLAELLATRRDFALCRAVIHEVSSYRLDAECHNWVRLHHALLLIQETGNLEEAAKTLKGLGAARGLERSLRLAVLQSLAMLHWLKGNLPAAKRCYLDCAELANTQPVDLGARAGALINLGILAKRTGESGDYYEEAAKLCAKMGGSQTFQQAFLEKELSDFHRLKGRFEEAAQHIETSLRLYGELGCEFELAHSIRTKAMLLIYTGQCDEAEKLFIRCSEIFGKCALPRPPRMFEQVWPLIGLGDAALGQERYDDAARLYAKAGKLCKGSEFERAVLLGCLAELACARGDWDAAVERVEESLELRRKHNDTYGIAWSLGTKGSALLGAGRPGEARDCFMAGLSEIDAYDSVFLNDRLGLGLCEAFLRLGSMADFDKTARWVERDAAVRRYHGILGRLRLLQGTRALSSPEPAPPNAGRIAACWCEALTESLNHNLVQLYALTREIGRELFRPGALPETLTVELLTELRRNWSEAEINGEAATRIERRARTAPGRPLTPTVLRQLDALLAEVTPVTPDA